MKSLSGARGEHESTALSSFGGHQIIASPEFFTDQDGSVSSRYMREDGVRIFLSSTFKDLQFERKIILNNIQSDRYTVVAMEKDCKKGFNWARWSKNEAGKCHVFIRLFDQRVGTGDPEFIFSLPPRSITETEYRHARQHAMKCLSYKLIRPLTDMDQFLGKSEMKEYLQSVSLNDKFLNNDQYMQREVEKLFRKGKPIESMRQLLDAIKRDLQISKLELSFYKCSLFVRSYKNNTFNAWRHAIEDEQQVWSTSRIFGVNQKIRACWIAAATILAFVFISLDVGLLESVLTLGVLLFALALAIIGVLPSYVWKGEKSLQLRSYFGFRQKVFSHEDVLSAKECQCWISKLLGYTAVNVKLHAGGSYTIRFVNRYDFH